MKEFLSYVRPYKKEAFLAIFCILSETVFELVIPLVMASIVDVGVANADTHYILMKGAQMLLFALIALGLGIGSSIYSAKCSQEWGRSFVRLSLPGCSSSHSPIRITLAVHRL